MFKWANLFKKDEISKNANVIKNISFLDIYTAQ